MAPINFTPAQLIDMLKLFAPDKREQLERTLRLYATGELPRAHVLTFCQEIVGPEVLREAMCKLVPGYDEMVQAAAPTQQPEAGSAEALPRLQRDGLSAGWPPRLQPALQLCRSAFGRVWALICWLCFLPPESPPPKEEDEKATLLRATVATETDESSATATKLRRGFLVRSNGLGMPEPEPAAPAPASAPPRAQMAQMSAEAARADPIAMRDAMHQMHAESMHALDPTTRELSMHNEWVQAEAKRTGNQGNVVIGPGGRMAMRDDTSAGGRTDRYSWGQSETEVTVRCAAPPGLRAKEVAFVAGTRRLSLRVRGEVVTTAAATPSTTPSSPTRPPTPSRRSSPPVVAEAVAAVAVVEEVAAAVVEAVAAALAGVAISTTIFV